MKNIIIPLLMLLLISGAARTQESGKSQIDSPSALTEYVTDETGTLNQSQLSTLRRKLKLFSDSTSTQIVVYMIPTLNGEPIEEAAIRIAAKNKIGKKGSNNGVLLLIAKNDRKLRIEVGYGLEGALTDALSKSIISNVISPSFKSGDYYSGIDKGVDAIILAVKGEYKAENKYQKTGKDTDYGWLALMIPLGVVFIVVILVIVGIRRASRGGYVSGRGYSGYSSYSSSSSSSYSSSDSYSSSSSSSSDSGFSGGGGDFGGGGASGDW